MNAILQNLGFDAFFEKHCKELQVELDSIARVIAEHKGIYSVKSVKGEFHARINGKQIFAANSREDYPAVGDWVVATMVDDDQAMISQVLPRKTVIRKTVASRKSTDKVKSQIIAANVDVAFVVESVDRDYSLNRFERYFALAEDGNVKPAIILNKVDLISRDDLNNKVAEIQGRFKNCMVVTTSTTTLEGLDSLRNSLSLGKTYCFLGSSGVGKSSLINALTGEKVAKTGAIGLGNERGRHVTTHREMFFLNSGGVVIDNPGMREVGLINSGVGLKATFAEIEEFTSQCKFTDCTHVHESGCAVKAAVESGIIDEDRYDNYIQLKKEVEHYDMTDFEKRDKDRKFGKFVKKTLKRMKDFE